MTIIVPMAGLSQRFNKEGYTLPKYMLYAGKHSLFNLAVSSFSNYFDSCKFLFIARNLFDTKKFIQSECEILGIINYEIVILDKPTEGQASTVYLGLNYSKLNAEEPITIFNIDTFRPRFVFPEQINEWDGYLEVFYGDGNNWSYAKTFSETSTLVIETAEKIQISNYCSTGLYYFKTSNLFKEAFESFDRSFDSNELYVAPLYNFLIKNSNKIHINLIDKNEVFFCGIPSEYLDYFKKLINA